MYLCPCGYYGDAVKACTCASSTVTKYQKRISGPLLDRIDIHLEVPRVDYQKLSSDRLGESSKNIQVRVEVARQRQRERFSSMKSNNVLSNADMQVGEVRLFCKLDEAGESLIRAAMGQMNSPTATTIVNSRADSTLRIPSTWSASLTHQFSRSLPCRSLTNDSVYNII